MRVKFNWVQNEGYSLGDNISDSSEKLLLRGRGKVSIFDFGEGRVHAIKHISFCRKFLLVS